MPIPIVTQARGDIAAFTESSTQPYRWTEQKRELKNEQLSN